MARPKKGEFTLANELRTEDEWQTAINNTVINHFSRTCAFYVICAFWVLFMKKLYLIWC